MVVQHAAKRWCFTINNPTDAEYQALVDSHNRFDYLVIGRERGDLGTPHLQGFVILQTRLRLRNVKLLPGFARAHLEAARGTPQQASDYCKKENDFVEYGSLPTTQGKRTDFESLKEWIKQCETTPTNAELAEEFPSLWGRYKSAVLDFVSLFGPRPSLVGGELRPWQRELDAKINGDADDRKIIFVYDPAGNKGKSWLTRYWFSTRNDVLRLSIGKRDDLAYAIDVTKKLFVFDVPRQTMKHLQYCVLEMIKDQMIFSPKYESVCKIIPHKCHVVVFCNEAPDLTMMSLDRFEIIDLSDNNIIN